MPYFKMRIFHTLQCNNSKDNLKKNCSPLAADPHWNPGGCIIDSSLITPAKTFIIKESKLKIPDSWDATGLCQRGCIAAFFPITAQRSQQRAAHSEQGHELPPPLALSALTNKWQQLHRLQTVCRTSTTRAWVKAFQVRFNILPCPQGFPKLPSSATSAQCARVTLSAVSVL